MNDHLRKISSKDTRETQDIMIISKVDAEIISELIVVFQKLKQKDLESILKKYKKSKDEDIRDLLLSWNTEYREDEGTEDKEEEPFINFEFQNSILRPSFLYHIEKDTELSLSGNQLQYLIYINRSEDTDLMYANLKFSFQSEEERDSQYEILKQKMELCNVKFI